MTSIKSPREIELMRQAGKVVAEVLAGVEKLITPGITTKQLDDWALEYIKSQNAIPAFLGYRNFPATLCTSINEVLIHGIPNQRKLVDGDIISVDVGVSYHGYYGDAARTFAVGEISEEAHRLITTTQESFYRGCALAKAGAHLGDICAAIGEYVYSCGYSVPWEYSGHGIGTELHESPVIPNYGEAGSGIILKAGMTLAIEPMVLAGSDDTEVAHDNWAVSSVDKALTAHYENTIVITETGYEILTIKEG